MFCEAHILNNKTSILIYIIIYYMKVLNYTINKLHIITNYNYYIIKNYKLY